VQLLHGFGGTQILVTEQISPILQSFVVEQNGLHTFSTQFSSFPQSVLWLQEMRGRHISPLTNSKGSGHLGGCISLQRLLSHMAGNTQSESLSQIIKGKQIFKTGSQVKPF